MTDNTDAPARRDTAAAAARQAATLEAMIEAVQISDPNTLPHRMGIVLTEVTLERLVATMPVAGNTQPYGLLHGGASVVLAETLGSIGSALHAGPDRIVVGVDINATHHRAARSGLVTGTATPITLGNTLASWQIVITDEDGRRICTSRITCLIRNTPPGARG